MTRTEMLQTAQRIVADREKSYGPPDIHFTRTVKMINALFGEKFVEPLTTCDWAQIMILDKLSREQARPKADTAIDIAGYASCLHRCRTERGEYGEESK